MMGYLLTVKRTVIAFLAILLVSAGGSVLAKKGGNGQAGNGGDGGGNDSPDPDYTILAVAGDGFVGATFVAETDCFAFNPDLKGPGVAYGGFYDNFGYITCAQTTTVGTNGGAVVDLKMLKVQLDEAGAYFSSVQLRGRNPDNGVVYESNLTPMAVTGQAPPENGGFTLQVRTTIDMYSCGTDRLKGNTVCDQPAGSITLGDLEYALLDGQN
jgi:hypothetical protein